MFKEKNKKETEVVPEVAPLSPPDAPALEVPVMPNGESLPSADEIKKEKKKGLFKTKDDKKEEKIPKEKKEKKEKKTKEEKQREKEERREKKKRESKDAKEPKQPKERDGKKSVLWAQVLVVLLVLSLGCLSLFKFVDYLNKPKTLILNSFETIYKDFESLIEEINSDEMYKILDSRGLEITSDIKLKVNNLKGEYEPMEEVLNRYSYIATTKINKANKYASSEVKMVEGQDEVDSFIVVLDKLNGYLSIPGMYDRYIKTSLNEKNLGILNTFGLIELLKGAKNGLNLNLKEDSLTREDFPVTIDGRNINAKKNSYTMSGTEAGEILDSILTAIKRNSDSKEYAASLFGVEEKEIESKFEEFKSGINLESDAQVIFSAYTDAENDALLRVEVEYGELYEGRNFTTTIEYDRYGDYKSLVKRNVLEEKYVTWRGTLNNSFELVVKKNDALHVLSGASRDNSKVGSIKIVDAKTGDVSLSGNYTYMLKNTSETIYSTSSILDITTYENGQETTLTFNTSSLIDSGVTISKKTIGTPDTLEVFKRVKGTNSLKTSIIDYISTIGAEVVAPPVEEEPQENPTDGDEANQGEGTPESSEGESNEDWSIITQQ